MRRSPIVIGATVPGTVGVLALHPSAQTVEATAATTSKSTTSASTQASGSTTASTSTTTTAASGTATGDAIATRYGNVQVKVTITDGKITNIQALQLTGL